MNEEKGKEEGFGDDRDEENEHSINDGKHLSNQQAKKMAETAETAETEETAEMDKKGKEEEEEEEQFPSKLHFYQHLVNELEHTIHLQTVELEVTTLFMFLLTS